VSVGACSRGRCVTSACAAVERDRKTFAGCVFYTAEVDNVVSDAEMPMSFLVTNPGTTAATVTLEQAADGGGWVATGAPSTIAAGTATRLSVAGFVVRGAGVKEASALRVTSSQPVTVAQIQSDDGNNHVASSSAGTMVLPAHVLGQHYLVMTYPQVDTPAIDATPGGAGGLGRLLIVATQPGTHVTLASPKVRPPTSLRGVRVPGWSQGPMMRRLPGLRTVWCRLIISRAKAAS